MIVRVDKLENWATKARASDCEEQVAACYSFFAQTAGVAAPVRKLN